jgi:hypothetical protein
VPDAARAEFAFATDPARIEEAVKVEPIADAFARAELRPRGNKGLGIYGLNMVKALGHQLGDKRLAKLTDAEEEAALHAIRAAVASGYVALMALEPDNPWSLQPAPDLRRMWDVTVASFRANGLRTLGVPDFVVKSVEQRGEDALITELRRPGVIGRRAGRIGLVGRYYAHAGGFIRATQTDFELPGRCRRRAPAAL